MQFSSTTIGCHGFDSIDHAKSTTETEKVVGLGRLAVGIEETRSRVVERWRRTGGEGGRRSGGRGGRCKKVGEKNRDDEERRIAG